MNLCNIGHNFSYEMEKLIRLFLPFEKITITDIEVEKDRLAVCKLYENQGNTFADVSVTLDGESAHFTQQVENTTVNFKKECQHELGRQLYNCLCELTKYKADWGILTGVRPAKLFSSYVKTGGSDYACDYFKNKFKVSESKISLCRETVVSEEKIISLSTDNSFSLYLSIPFCPTRCSYCSFVSHSVASASEIIPKYVELLCREIEITAQIAKELNLRLETVYIGGGTPTTLTPHQLDVVLKTVNCNFDTSHLREFTVEAGRPDTIDKDKLNIIKQNGATRISINPQTLNNSVLEAIGRRHTADDTLKAFALARSVGFNNINTDLIAGLPTDTLSSFENTLQGVIDLSPESVTVHALSMKRASLLTTRGEYEQIKQGAQAAEMVDYARGRLSAEGILPYYMYRQSKTVGNLENVGYARSGFEGLYNVYIMDETHTILACGASAVTKLKDSANGQIKRIFNYKYPYEYISGFDELMSRKKGVGEFYDEYLKGY